MRLPLAAALLFSGAAFAQPAPDAGPDGGPPPMAQGPGPGQPGPGYAPGPGDQGAGDQQGPGPQGGGAYPPAPGQEGGPPTRGQHGPNQFDRSNTTHDGRLTREQAQAGGMKHVADHFDEIDTGQKGYVTKQDIRAWRHARRQAHQAQQPPPTQQQ